MSRKPRYTKIPLTITAETVLWNMRMNNGDYQEELAELYLKEQSRLLRKVQFEDYVTFFQDLVEQLGDDVESKQQHLDTVLDIAPLKYHKQLKERLALELL